MSGSPGDELIESYIEEVKSYVPMLVKGIESLKNKPDQSDVLEETHRLVHTIKGASAMVGINGLSHIAYHVEEALEDIMEGKRPFSDEAYHLLTSAVDQFDLYCKDYIDKGVDAKKMFMETAIAVRRFRGLPKDGDEDALKAQFSTIPVREGGGPEEIDSENSSEIVFAPLTDDPVELETISDLEVPDDEIVIPDDDTFLSDEAIPDDEIIPGLDAIPDEEDIIPDIVDLIGNDDFPDLAAIPESNNLPEDIAIPDINDMPDFTIPDEPEALPEDDIDFTEVEPAAPPIPDLPPELIESFREEAEEHLDELSRSLTDLEQQITGAMPLSADQKEIVRQVRRNVHTIKGASAVIGLTNISNFAHSWEDFLDWIYESSGFADPEIMSTMLDSADLLQSIVEQPQDPKTNESGILKQKYASFMEQTGGQVGVSLQDTVAEPAIPETPVPEDPPPPTTIDLPPELIQSFNEEAEEHLEELCQSLSDLESEIEEPTVLSNDQKEVIRKVRRNVHTIKGASAVIGLTNISTFAHCWEDLLDWIYESSGEIDPETISMMVDSADLLQRIVENPGDPQTTRVNDFKTKVQPNHGRNPIPVKKQTPEPEPITEPPPQPANDIRPAAGTDPELQRRSGRASRRAFSIVIRS